MVDNTLPALMEKQNTEKNTGRRQILSFLNWSPPNAETQGLIPPVPAAIINNDTAVKALQRERQTQGGERNRMGRERRDDKEREGERENGGKWGERIGRERRESEREREERKREKEGRGQKDRGRN